MPVVNLDVRRREPYAGGATFGDSGPYERIDGLLTFAVDPGHEANRAIVDLDLAPRDGDGRVRFRADFTMLAPREPARGNGRVLVELPNRGRRRAVAIFNRSGAPAAGTAEIAPGDGFLFRHGYAVASIGWQWDVYRSDALMALDAPEALVDGRAVRGQAVVEIRPNVVEHTRLLANRVHRPYPAADVDDPDAVLLVRDYEDGEDNVIPRDEWRFAREAGGEVEPSREHIHLPSGFQPGKIYYAVYTTEGAPIVGTGLLAVRDVASFLRHDSESNPYRGGFERVYGFGVSQTGRMLRHFLHLGLNVDEQGGAAYDGLLPHVAGGRRGEFNHRFAQPSAQSVPGFGHLFPFADDETTDPLTGVTDGLLARLRNLGAAPKVIYTNTSAEYWRGDGSLLHIDAGGERDLEPAPESRIYHFAGTQHGPGVLPQRRQSPNDGASGRYGFNVVDYAPLLRAALVNLDRWVSAGVEPPPSRHPRLSDGTAVERSEVLQAFEPLPDQATPDPARLWVLRTVDLGAEAGAGIGRYPVVEGEAYPCLVSAVDADGNETAGVRLPDVTSPVATHAGWNLRDPETGAPEQQMAMQGCSRFFAPTRSAREAAGDPRPSLEERYESRESYLDRVRSDAEALAAGGYLLDEDVELVVANAADRYDVALSETREHVGVAGGG